MLLSSPSTKEMSLEELCSKLQELDIEVLSYFEKAHGIHVVLPYGDLILSRISNQWLVNETKTGMPISWPTNLVEDCNGVYNEIHFKDKSSFFEIDQLDFVLKCVKRIK